MKEGNEGRKRKGELETKREAQGSEMKGGNGEGRERENWKQRRETQGSNK
jgi:hypothetical protein